MYKIGLRSGSPVSAGQMIQLPGGANQLVVGAIACCVEGRVSNLDGDRCPDVLIGQAGDLDEYGYAGWATCMLLTEDMILEAPISGTDLQIESVHAGKLISFDRYGVSASGSSEYCLVVDTLGAKTAGDPVLVRFINNHQKGV